MSLKTPARRAAEMKTFRDGDGAEVRFRLWKLVALTLTFDPMHVSNSIGASTKKVLRED